MRHIPAFFACLSSLAAAEIRFTEVTEQAGLVAPLAGLMGHGGAWGDFDGDGRLDLFVGGFCDRPDAEYQPAQGPVPSRLFRNLGNGRFEPVAQPATTFFARTSGAVFADLDNDGALDLYVANNARKEAGKKEGVQRDAVLAHSRLLRNKTGTFTDISADSGACPDSLLSARNIGVADYDGDGLLDLFIVEDKFTRSPRSVLLRNLGGLKFKDTTKEAGLPEDIFGLGLAVADINGDGRPDFFVGHSQRLFLSQPGNTYLEATGLRDVFAWKPLDGEDWPCGAAFADLNRDARLDLVISIHGVTARNRVYLNDGLKDGIPRFRDATHELGMGGTVPAKCPHVEVQDFDNDGWPDIYMSAAWLDDGNVTPLIHRNTGWGKFEPPRPIKGPMIYFPAGPSGDFDNDGRLDLFLVNWFPENRCRLLRNNSPVRHWLNVQVAGKTMNRMGIGAKILIHQAGVTLGFQEIGTGYGYASGQPAIGHFGLGDETSVDVRVTLPNGKTIECRDVKADQILRLEEP